MSNCIAAFDVESTGVDITDRPVQVCLTLRAEGVDRILFNELTNPCMNISEGAMAVHGITNEMVAGMPDYAMTAWKLKVVVQSLGLKPVLVTFNGRSLDVPMINRCLGAEVFEGLDHVDVLQFARRHFPLVKGNVSKGGKTLGELYLHFMGKELVGAHDASVDVKATLDLLDAMRKKAGMTLDALIEDQKTYKPYAIMPLGAHIGKSIDEVPRSWAQFMKDKELDGDLKATVDYILGRA